MPDENKADDDGDIFDKFAPIIELAGVVGEFVVGKVKGNKAQDDEDDGIQPSDAYFESGSRGVWEFEDKEGFSVVSAGEHSYFLVFSSSQDWVKGNYEIENPEDEFPVPIPEPATVALLGIGAMIFTRQKKRKSVQ